MVQGKLLKEIIEEATQHTEKYQKLLESEGYKKQTSKVVDGHISFIHRESDMFLIDVPGDEWHYLLRGTVTNVGSLKDHSLVNFLMS